MGRVTVRLPWDEVKAVEHDAIHGVLTIVLEADHYPEWQPGMEPVCVFSEGNLVDAVLEESVRKSVEGQQPGGCDD